jgi:hypothetical protein
MRITGRMTTVALVSDLRGVRGLGAMPGRKPDDVVRFWWLRHVLGAALALALASQDKFFVARLIRMLATHRDGKSMKPGTS